MTKNPLSQLTDYGQSFWLDNIHRGMLENGDFAKMMQEDNVRGITSNPSIFEKAIAGSAEYDQALSNLISSEEQPDSRSAFFSLAVEDIQKAADLLKPVYDETNALDGYVSLEVSPDLAHDSEASIKEAQELFLRLDRPNVMIKIPSTKAGIPVIEKLIADGINVNATLLFSVERYLEVAKAYIRGLSERHQSGMPIENINSVASFFVSRVDSKLDSLLEPHGEASNALKGQMAVANAKVAYKEYLSLFGSEEFATLEKAGANPQRLLWASTGTKNPDYSDVLYIESLIGENTVNTIPPATAQAFRDHGKCEKTLHLNLDNAEHEFAELVKLGVDVNSAMDELETEGVAAFEKSFNNLLQAIDDKMESLKNNPDSNVA